MTKAEAIAFFTQQAKEKQQAIDELKEHPETYFVDESHTLWYINECQTSIDACKLAIAALGQTVDAVEGKLKAIKEQSIARMDVLAVDAL